MKLTKAAARDLQRLALGESFQLTYGPLSQLVAAGYAKESGNQFATITDAGRRAANA